MGNEEEKKVEIIVAENHDDDDYEEIGENGSFEAREGNGCNELGSMEPNPEDCASFLICNHNEYQKNALSRWNSL